MPSTPLSRNRPLKGLPTYGRININCVFHVRGCQSRGLQLLTELPKLADLGSRCPNSIVSAVRGAQIPRYSKELAGVLARGKVIAHQEDLEWIARRLRTLNCRLNGKRCGESPQGLDTGRLVESIHSRHFHSGGARAQLRNDK